MDQTDREGHKFLDNADYPRRRIEVIRKAISLILSLFSFVLSGAPAATATRNAASAFDAQRLKTGTFIYQDLEGDKEVGQSQLTVEQLPGTGTFCFSNVSTGKFSQRWQAVTTSGLDAISANLSFGAGAGTPAFELNYTSGRVTGFVVERKGSAAGTRRPISDAVPRGIVDQRVDWAAVTASDLKSSRRFEFNVYDPSLGTSHVLVRIADVRAVRVPAGEFQVYPVTYDVKKRSGTESYMVFVSTEEPRILVREEFPDGSRSDLVSITHP